MKHLLLTTFLLTYGVAAPAQSLRRLTLDDTTYAPRRWELTDGQTVSGVGPRLVGPRLVGPRSVGPLLSLELNGQPFSTDQLTADHRLGERLQLTVNVVENAPQGVKATLVFRNVSADTLRLGNVLPLLIPAEPLAPTAVYITGRGNHPLSRTYVFRPGRAPVNCIVPDNAWELGYAGVPLTDSLHLCALTRRDRASIRNGLRRRFETVLYPQGGEVTYYLYVDTYRGDWQEGLRRMFQERYLYDLPHFDETLFRRPDLGWMRHAYVMHLVMTWNHLYYDYATKRFGLPDFLARGQRLYGGDDVVGIWPTWPTLGLDARNQFDMFRDLPGGLSTIRGLSDQMKRRFGTKLFVCYNPWDESTRSEGHLVGLERIIRQTGADGVVLDTKGESSRELQETADRVRPGIIMYSEGMAVPRDMPGIVSGRVHNALYYPPLLNLNKFIRPDFAIFRVAELHKERIRREFALSFFNGYGTELNLFPAGLPDWLDEQYRYLGRTTRILRENTDAFTARSLTPLLETLRDSLYVNRWVAGDKTLYTVFSLVPEGFRGSLFAVAPKPGVHYVDLWHHDELTPRRVAGQDVVEVTTDAFARAWLGTNNEGEVGCIAQLPELLTVSLDNDVLQISARQGTDIRVWAGPPNYEKTPLTLKPGHHALRLLEHFGRFEGKFVVQLLNGGILRDERVVTIPAGTPRLAATATKTKPATAPKGMVRIPGGTFTFRATNGDEFITYPKHNIGRSYAFPAFWMDKHPVTNAQFNAFLKATQYRPADTTRFLRHWPNGRMPAGQAHYPVVYVTYEDAQAYARWAGKRLPTELEWQFAAQTPDERAWPWSADTKNIRREIEVVNETLSVYRIRGIDSVYANLGNGTPDPVGKYPQGANPYGLEDLVGSVWQLTNDLYVSGSYRYVLMKGGSFYNPSSSWWYVQGGPRELHYRQFLLRVSPGFERNATVGFRCVAD